MPHTTLKQTLRTIGREAVPETWDRWPEIHERVLNETPSRRYHSGGQWLKRVAALAVVLLLSSSALYAFVQITQQGGDTGLTGVLEAEYATDLTLTRMVGDIEVRLNWGYADSGRIMLNYQTFLVRPDGARDAADADAPFIVRLIERDGQLPDLYPNAFNGSSLPVPVGLAFFLPQQLGTVEPLPDTLDLRLELVFEEQPRIRGAIERFFTGTSSTGVSLFGDGSTAPLVSDATREPLPPGIGPFTFDFTLPVLHAIRRTPMETVTVNSVSMTLESLAVAPSKTDFRLCFTPPIENLMWSPQGATLAIGENETNYGGATIYSQDDGRLCGDHYVQLFAELPAALMLTIPAIETHPPHTAEAFQVVQQAMAAQGITMELDIRDDGTVDRYTWPNDARAQAILVELGYRVEGPWVFTLELPTFDLP